MLNKIFLTLVILPSAVPLVALADNGPAPNPNTVILEVDGTKITYAQLEQKRGGPLFQARNAFYEAERKSVEDYVNDFLIEREAKKEGLTVDQLFEKHVKNKIAPDPSDEALHLYYEGIDSKEPFDAIRTRMLDHIRDVRMAKIKAEYVQSIRNQAKVVVEVPAPRAIVSLGNTPVRGSEQAPVIMVEYADYECPYCQQAQDVLDKLESQYKGKIAFVYKDYPLPMHSHAEKAAEAAHCAGAQGKYWEYHDMLFKNKKLDVPQLKETARNLSLDSKAFESCLDSGAQAEAVKKDAADGQTLQVQGTPSFLINGRFINGNVGLEEFQRIIDEELKNTGAASSVKQAARE